MIQIPGCIPSPVTTWYTLTVNVKGQGTVHLFNNVESYTGGTIEEGARLTLTAEPTNPTEWHFDRWKGDSVGVNSTTLITMDSDKTVTAVFKSITQYTLTVNIEGQGTVTPASGTEFSIDEEVILQATPAIGYNFSHWSGDVSGTNPSHLLVMSSNKTVTAVFEPANTELTVNVQGQGTVEPNGGTFPIRQPVTMTATPAEGWHFLEWQGDLTGYTATTQITMDTDKNITALFEQNGATYPLTVNVTGQGTVDPNGGTYYANQKVSLTATPADGWHFVQWEGNLSGNTNPAVVTMDSTKTVTAVFRSDIQYTLTTQVHGQGTIALSPNTATYNVGDVVTLTATPALSWDFSAWSGAATGSVNPVQVTMDQNLNVTATFIKQDLPRIELQTTMGNIVLELNRPKAPITVDNFVQYVIDGFYDGQDGKGATIFHRVIPDFMAQGGGLTVDMVQKTTRDPIQNESNNGLSNLRGTISMARTSDPNSATSQFFINVVDNTYLDYGSIDNPDGYAVFGNVIQGMNVVDAIVSVPTDSNNTPITPIIINSAKVLP